jgi:serine/threonine protein kinase
MARDEFSADSLLGAVIDDRFQIMEKLGEGGMGAIYKARQISVDRMVALKILLHDQRGDPISVERFRHEAYLASRLKHPNAIVIHDFGQTVDGLLYIAMEFLSGETLKQRLRRVGPMKVEGAVKIMTQTLRTIAEAHRMGMVHRDLKPDNVFLTEMEGDRDFVKVLDFGIAKLTAVQDGVEGYQGGLTMAGKIYGTPNYMSPEQIRGKPVEPQSDLYSLGIIFYEILAGRLPFVAQTPVEVMMMHLRDLPPALRSLRPEINVELERTVLRALEKDRRARYQSADEFLEALENYKFNSGFYAVPAQLAARVGRSSGSSQPEARPEPEPLPADSLLDASEDGQSFHDERTFLEFGDEPQATPAAEERTLFEHDDASDASQEGDLDDGLMMGPSVDALPGGGLATGMNTGFHARGEESTMLELDDGELMEVEPSRIVPIAEVEAASKATRTGMPVQKFEPPPPRGPAPMPVPEPPAPRAPPPSAAEKRTLMGHPAPPPSPPATPSATPPPVKAAPARAPEPSPQAGQAVPAAPVLKAPPRDLNPRPTAVGLPAGGPVQRGVGLSRKWIAIAAAVSLTALAIVGVVLLDPFGASTPDVPLTPPKLIVSSEPAGVEVFDRNLFVGETPVEHPFAPVGDAHQLQFSKGKSSWRARLDEVKSEVWLHVRLPASGSGELGTATIRSQPAGASVRVDAKEIGRTPLTLLGSNGTAVRFQVELPGFAPQEKDATLAVPGQTLDVTLAKP